MARYGCTITVDTGKMPSSQTDFVWLATADNFPTAAVDGGLTSILNGGGNLRCYTDDTKATQIPIEVVTFVTGGTPDVQVWGLSPTLNVASTVYIEADTVATTQPAAGAAFGRNATWVQHELVIHQGTIVDSTGNHTPVLNGSPLLASMMWGGSGYNIISSGQYISVPNSASLNIEKNYTTNAWVKYGTVTGTAVRPVLSKVNASNSDGFWLFVLSDDLRSRHPDLSAANLDINSNLIDNTTYRLGSDFDGTTRKTIVDTSSSSDTPTGTVVTTTEDLRIGSTPSLTDDLAGTVGDVWLKKASVTDDMRTGEQNNQLTPDTFWTTSAWIDQDAGSGISIAVTEVLNSFVDSSNINIDYNVNATVTETLNSFSDTSVISVTSGQVVNLSVTETLSAFTDLSNVNVSANIDLIVTEVLNSFLDGSNVTIAKELTLQVTEVLNSFADNSSVRLPANWNDKPKVTTSYTTQTPVSTIWIDKG